MVPQKKVRTQSAIFIIRSIKGIWLDRVQSEIGIFFLRKYFLPSCVRKMFWVTILYKYQDFARLGGKFQIHLNINAREESLKAAKGGKKGVNFMCWFIYK